VRYVASDSALRVLIATQPRPAGSGVDLASDVALTKAALLYADSVELVSPGAAMIASAGALESATTSDAVGLLGQLDQRTLSHLGGASLPDNWLQIVQGVMALNQLTPAARQAALGDYADDPHVAELLDKFRDLSGPTEQLRTIATSLVDASGFRELDLPIKLGLVTVTSVGIDKGSTDAVVAEYVAHIKRALRDPTVHALFDESTASLARSLISEGQVEPSRVSMTRAREAAVSGGMVARLPSFPDSESRIYLPSGAISALHSGVTVARSPLWRASSSRKRMTRSRPPRLTICGAATSPQRSTSCATDCSGTAMSSTSRSK
jgi:hypothetical protein